MNINTDHSANSNLLNLRVCSRKWTLLMQKVSTPEPSERWHPVAHDALVEQFRSSIDNTELEIVNEHHSLHRLVNAIWLFQVKGLNRGHGDDVVR